MTTSFRQDAIAAIKATLDAFVVSDSSDVDSIQAAYTRRPASFGDLPCAYIGTREEDVRSDVATRDRVLRTSIVLVDRITDNVETQTRLDILVDRMLDALQAAMRSAEPHGPLIITGVVGDELPTGTGAPYSIEVIGLTVRTQEGTGL